MRDSHSMEICPMKQIKVLGAVLVLWNSLFATQAPPTLKLEKGDHVSVIGNTLADRMQHAGWLETFLHSRFPQHELVIRNLGFAADELTIRLRSANFGS